MFDPDAGMPRINRGMVYLGACLIAGIRLAASRRIQPDRIAKKRGACQRPRVELISCLSANLRWLMLVPRCPKRSPGESENQRGSKEEMGAAEESGKRRDAPLWN
jgi:hypothetical protein